MAAKEFDCEVSQVKQKIEVSSAVKWNSVAAKFHGTNMAVELLISRLGTPIYLYRFTYASVEPARSQK